MTTRLAKWHFCPTESNEANLLREGVAKENIHVVGNTVIDALLMARDKIARDPSVVTAGYEKQAGRRCVLITGHRRENFGDGFENICGAIRRLAEEFQDVDFVYPVHLNPNVREPVNRILGDHVRRNVKLLEPLGYLPFVKLMMNADAILTDSGGVQEEAPSLGKPVLVMRDTTERPEAVTAGTVKIVGTRADSIYENVKTLLTNRAAYEAMSAAVNPYGDGKAVGRIMEVLRD